MRSAGFQLLFLFLVCSLLSGVLLFPQTERLPSQVFDYYEDWNHLSAYSTREERMELLPLLETRPHSKGSGSPRLAEVIHRMRKIKARIFFADPKMVAKTGKVSPLLRNLFYRTELVKVQKFFKSEDHLSVKVNVIDLEPEDIIRLIAELARNSGQKEKDALFNSLASSTDRNILSRTEFHNWSRIGTQWMRSDGSLLLLKK